MKNIDGSYNDPLHWWSKNCLRFPLIATLAAQLLAITATSAPSERVFSAAGLTITKGRARLDHDNAGELVFLHETVPAMEKYNMSRMNDI
jgi:zinc finger BED domain-containing protein 1 (E3 SUMO-protein ligase ZBED1)